MSIHIGIIVYGIHYMRNSELFLGKRCMDVYISDYVTEKEKKEMLTDCYWIAFYPKKYQDSPQALRERIRKNKTIIKDREFQSHFKRVSLIRTRWWDFDFCMFENQMCEINSYKIKTNLNQTL